MAGSPGPWSVGLFDCLSDCSVCCLTTWCPCVAFGRLAEIVDKGTSSCCACGTLFCLLHLTRCGWILSAIFRSRMRERYNLEGSTCGDICLGCFCEGCTLCQAYRELQHQGFDVAAGWEGNVRRRNPGVEMAPTMEGGMKR